MNKRILVVSSANLDFVQRMRRIPNSGESVIETPEFGYSYVPGGKGANSAVTFARLKDDCVRFDPMERAEQHTGDPLKNVGLKVVTGISDEMLYQHMMGLNVLTIWI
jgi:hypothetical protein